MYGLSWVVTTALGAMVALSLLDYLVRFQDIGLRVICSLSVAWIMVWACYRFLYLPLFVRLRNVELAQKLERRFPGLEDRLVSSVEFLRTSDDDPTAGSAELRRAVIDQATSETERLDFSELLDTRVPVRAAVTTAAVCLTAVILAALDPPALQIAVARIVNPFGQTAWPRRNHIEFVDRVERVARGGVFEVELIDAKGARLPTDVLIHYRFDNPDGGVTVETEPIRPIGSRLVARRENVARAFSYRAEGGDDRSMPWTAVKVVDPPAITALSIRLIPPKYTGCPPRKSKKNIRALVGTRMEIAAKTTKPLAAVALCMEGDRRIPGRISRSGRRFTAPGPESPEVQIDRSGSYWFELTGRNGLKGGRGDRWEIRAVPDTPPSVTIDRPTAKVFVTPKAVVPIKVSAEDDLALHEIALVFELTSQTTKGDRKSAILLYRRDAGTTDLCSQCGGFYDEQCDHRTVKYRWELEKLGLTPGVQITFHAAAADYLPQTGTSEPRQVIVISDEQLQNRLADWQDTILAEVARVLKMQLGCRSQLEAILVRLDQLGQLEHLDVDRLQAVELNQRRVSHSLTDRSEGVRMHVLVLLAEVKNNRLDRPGVQQRMTALLDEIDRLRREHLTPADHELTVAIKSAINVARPFWPCREEPNKPNTAKMAVPQLSVARLLDNAGGHQNAVVASLERILGRLTRSDGYRRFHREIGALLRDQETLLEHTVEIGRRTLTWNLEDLGAEDLAELKILSARQLELARQFDRIRHGMDRAAEELRQSDPHSADTLAVALSEATQLAVGTKMHSAGSHIRNNRVGRATARQKQINAELQRLLDILADRQRNDLDHQKDGSDDSAGAEQKPGDTPSTTPTERKNGDEPDGNVDMDRMRELIKGLWGELPAHQREQMLQLPIEEFLPKYELLIEKYFRRLSEGNDAK